LFTENILYDKFQSARKSAKGGQGGLAMKVELTLEQLRRPLGSDITDPEARRFFSRVGPVNFCGDDDDEGFGVPEGEPIDFAALNRQLDEDDKRFLELINQPQTPSGR
jgi:hypothetical protein